MRHSSPCSDRTRTPRSGARHGRTSAALCQNHAFVDGNKRIAWATTRAFLLANGIGIAASTAVVEDLVVRLAAGHVTEEEVLTFFETYGYVTEEVRSVSDERLGDLPA